MNAAALERTLKVMSDARQQMAESFAGVSDLDARREIASSCKTSAAALQPITCP
jgi:hypothetical protein